MPFRKDRSAKNRKSPSTKCGTVTRLTHDEAKKLDEKKIYPANRLVAKKVKKSAGQVARALRKIYGEEIAKKMSHPKKNSNEHALNQDLLVSLVRNFSQNFLEGKTPHKVIRNKILVVMEMISKLPEHGDLKRLLLGYSVGPES